MVQRCYRLGISVLMTFELPELVQLVRLSDIGISHVSANVVVLQYLRQRSEVQANADGVEEPGQLAPTQIREFVITPEGITFGGEITGLSDPH